MKANDWIKKDMECVWHPYTQMKDCRENPPILVKKAKGMKLYEESGRFYYDTISSWWCNVHGHGHKHIKDAIKKQLGSLEHVVFAGFTHEPAIELAERLIDIAPGKLRKVFFSDNGSTAVEVALKMSLQYWQNKGIRTKTRFISLDCGYHGDTFGTMSVSGVDMFNAMFSSHFFPGFKVPAPYCYRCPMGKKSEACSIDCLKPLKNILERESKNISGLIIEPMVLCAGGMIVYPEGYFKKAAFLAKKHGVHLIVDEVATGFGRTGKMFASEGIGSDLMCVSKGITGGFMPLAATLATDKIYNAFYADFSAKKTFFHGHTYTANPIACSAALASLDIFKKEKTLARVKKTAGIFAKRLEGFRGLDHVGDVRHIGLIGAIELEGFKPEQRIGMEIYKRGLKKNIILRPLGSIIYLFLPLCVTPDELDDIMDRVYCVISTLRKNA